MWQFVSRTPAQRRTQKFLAVGAMQSTLVNVSGDVYRKYTVQKVIPAILSKFPSESKRVILQYDNATLHASVPDVRRQPPNNQDLNVLDLGFVASIQSLQYKVVIHTVDDVIHATLLAFAVLSVEKLENVFLTLQAVMRLILEHDSGNHFKLSHLKKDTLRRAGALMANLTCPVSLLGDAALEEQL
ncbi:Aste57867_12416 [Aphanomyces stellatus]|uniref:Aste57867_12416 protein n=1 Tax=Aphanomyces stellatus TaxID=120398 RepID=A0A485KVW7_9STRA|nr:hypothetical protein As57867_012370 [Aphanomyces stellatus]VFT89267.1 Aste57867_12416 [Aphanomyces stellatus]